MQPISIFQVQLLRKKWKLQSLQTIMAAWHSMAAAQAAKRHQLKQRLQGLYIRRLFQAWQQHTAINASLKADALVYWQQAVAWRRVSAFIMAMW